MGDGWYRISIEDVCTTTSTNSTEAIWTQDASSGDGISGFYIWGSQLEQSNFTGKYQRINAATDYDTNGFEYYAQFDGVDDYLKSLPFTLNQPTSIYSCLKQDSFTTNDAIFDGNALQSGQMRQITNPGILRIFNVTAGLTTGIKTTIGTFDNIYTLFSDTTLSLKQNNLTMASTQGGSNSLNGFILAASGSMISNSNISVKEIIIKRIATDESDTIFNYFKNKHKVQY